LNEQVKPMVAVILIDNDTDLHRSLTDLLRQATVVGLTAGPLLSDQPKQGGFGGMSVWNMKGFPFNNPGSPESSPSERLSLPQRDERSYLSLSGIDINVGERRIEIDGRTLPTNYTQFKLLQLFFSFPEIVFSRRQILDSVWDHAAFVQERTVDTHIHRLRDQLAENNRAGIIQTVRGFGYRCSALKA
jgi:hypothetical protein